MSKRRVSKIERGSPDGREKLRILDEYRSLKRENARLKKAIQDALVGLQTLALTEQLASHSTAIGGVVSVLHQAAAKGEPLTSSDKTGRRRG